MAMDFRRFLAEMVGGNTPQVPAFQQQQPPVIQQPIPPMQGPLPTIGYQAPNPVQIAPAPVQAPPPPMPGPSAPQQALSPAQFAAQQGPVQGPQPADKKWVTVSYQYNGVNYMLLMPEENAQNLPDGASLVSGGEITDPEKVARAYEAGSKGQQGQTFIGALEQAPPEIQGVFRSSQDVLDISSKRPVAPLPVDDEGNPVPWYASMENPTPLETTQVPPIPVASNRPESSGDVTREGLPALTTEALRKYDEPKAALLESNGIFEIEDFQMAVQYQDGTVKLVPASETPPEGATILTYGGLNPNPSDDIGTGWLGTKVIGDPGDWMGSILNQAQPILEGPQRELQSLVSDATMFYIDEVGAPGDSLLTGLISGTPGGTIGLGGFTTWIMENPDAARQAKEVGYVAPDGQRFTGNRAIWELYQSERNLPERALDTTFSDPWNVVPSMGAPVRGIGTAVGNVRRGVGYTDEVIDVVNGADNVVDAVAPITRTAQEILTNPATIVDDTAMTAAEQAARTNPITGTGVVPEVIDVVPGQAVAPVVANTATRAEKAVDNALGATEVILNTVADVLDIPENALGALVDRGIITIKSLVDVFGAIPAPDGRTIGDLWNRTTDQSVLRNTEEEISTVFDDTMGLERREPPVSPTTSVVDEAVPPPAPPRAPEFPATPISTPEPVLPVERTGSGQQPLLATDRPIDDLGTPPAPVAAADAVLPTDRPIDDLTPRTPEELAVQRDEQFLATPEGQRTQKIMDRWDKTYADMPFIKPQTGMQRIGGEGRLDEAFQLRPMDAARELAADHPREYESFLKAMDHSQTGVKKFVDAERARQRTDAKDLGFTSGRNAAQSENGVGVRSAWEVMNEADHLVNRELPAFNAHMGAVEKAPEYQWKRWGRAGESHTAMDTLAQNGGRYQEGMPLHEAFEVAIYHPDDNIAVSALEDITNRIAQRNDAGQILVDTAYGPLRKTPLKDALSRARNNPRSIRNLRRNYLEAIGTDRRVTPTPIQQPVDSPVPTTPTATDLTSDGSIGGQVADLTEAATALDDIAMEARNVPLPLPYRATSTIRPTESLARLGENDGLAVTMPGPRGADVAPAGGQTVPPSAVQRQQQALTRIDRQTELFDLRKLNDYRANAQRSMDTDPLTRGERRAQSRRDHLASRAEGKAKAMRNTATPVSRMDLQSFYVRGRPVSASQAEVFGQKFSNGETLAARWDRYTIEEMDKLGKEADLDMAEGLAASRTINDYVVEIMPDDIRTRYDKFLKEARSSKIEDAEGNKINRTELMAQNHALEQIRRQPRTGRTAGFWRRYDRVMTAIRQTFLYNWLTGPRYITTQMVGNSTTAALTGHSDILGDIMSPKAIREAWRASRNEGVLPRSIMDEASEGYGLSGRRNITRGDSSVRDQTIEQAITEKNKYSLLGRYTRPIADRQIRDMAAAFDRLPREAMWASIMDTNLSVARRNLWEQMEATIPDGASYAQARKLFDDLPQRFSSDDFRDTFADFDATWVDRNARDWQEAITKTDKAAKAEVKRTFFDGTEKNIDTYMKRVLFFHYWMSRATPLYTEAIARDPVVLYNFMKMLEATRDDSDGSGANFLKFFSTPMGYNILIRPDAMLATFASFWEDAGFTPDGESKLGMVLRNSPIMVNPLVQSALNLTGFMGDTFGPDPVGANKFIQLIQATADNANAQFGWDWSPTGNIQETTMRQIRDFVSGFTSEFIPGAEHIEFTDPMAYKDNEVRSIVAEIALERGMELDDPIVQEAMVNPSSEMYQEAMKRYAMQDAMDIGLRILPVTAVLYPKSQLASPKERSIGMGQEREEAERLGIGRTPRGEQLEIERDTIGASTEYSRTMQLLQDEYTAIGTPEEQGAYRFYNGIRYASATTPIVVGGKSYSPDELAALEPGAAESLADQWAEETGNTERVAAMSEQRKAFREEHPEYQEFVSWSGQVRDYETGVRGWWEDTAQGNPNAARWFNGLTEEQKNNDIMLTSLDAYFAANGDQLMYWDQTPIETNTPLPPDPYMAGGTTGEGTGGGSSSPQSYGPTKQGIDEQIMEYQAEMEAYNEMVRMILNQPPGFRLDLVNPMAQQAIEANLRQAGIEPPRMGRYLYDYLQWAEMSQGGDTSVDAYLRWYETQNPPATETPAA